MTERTLPWIVVADRHVARLLEPSFTEHERLHLEERGSIEDTWEQHEHGRPSPRMGKNGHTYASEPHEFEERSRRFAREFVEWIGTKRVSHSIEQLEVFLAPRFLGYVRKQQGEHPPWAEHECDLAQLKLGALARHGTIEALFQDLDLTSNAG